jgi:Zn-finger nucleic acid-binding protein
MKCPTDNATLVMSERNGIEIDYCPDCRGVWLDRGELDKIIDRASAEAPAAVQAAPVQAAPAQYPAGAQQGFGQQPYDNRGGYDQRGGYDNRGGYNQQQPYRKKKENWLSELFD